MSNGEAKRWEPCFKDSPAGTYVSMKETKRVRDVFVQVEEHDRIVADLKAQLEHSETKVGWLLRDNEKNVTELKAEIERQRDAYEATLENHVRMQLEIARLRR